MAELLSTANECMDKAVEFVQAKVDEFGWKVFGREDALQKINKLSEFGIDRQKKIIKILEESPEGTIAQLSNLQKGNYGEMKMDIFYDELGYDRISLDRTTDLDAPARRGIDGVYYNPDGHPPYIIAEAKFGSARLGVLKDGTPQMGDKWIIDRLKAAIGEEMANKIRMEMISNPDNVGTVLVNVSANGFVKKTQLIDGIKK